MSLTGTPSITAIVKKPMGRNYMNSIKQNNGLYDIKNTVSQSGTAGECLLLSIAAGTSGWYIAPPLWNIISESAVRLL